MMAEDIASQSRRKMRKMVLSLALGGAIGFSGAVVVGEAIESGVLGAIDVSRGVALGVALLYLLMAAMVGFGVLSPKLGAKVLNVEDGQELIEQRRLLGLSAIGTLAIGGLLSVLALAAPAGPIPDTPALGIALALGGVAGVSSWIIYREMDELMHVMVQDAGACAFNALMLVGGTWVALAHLDRVAPPAPLDWLSLFFGVLLLASFWATWRRGQLAMR